MSRFLGGWVKLYRKAALGDINSNFIRGGLYAALRAMANIQPTKVTWRGKPRDLGPGEVLTAIRELSELGGVDQKTVAKHLNYLALRKVIEVEKSVSGIIVRFLEADENQELDATRSARGPQAMEGGMEGPMEGGVRHIEELKNIEPKKKRELAFAFSLFPVQVFGLGAVEEFCRQIKTDADFEDLINALEKYKAILKAQPWRSAKQSFAAFLGNASDGYFWRGFLNPVTEVEPSSGWTLVDVQAYWFRAAKACIAAAQKHPSDLPAFEAAVGDHMAPLIRQLGGASHILSVSSVPGGLKRLSDELEHAHQNQQQHQEGA